MDKYNLIVNHRPFGSYTLSELRTLRDTGRLDESAHIECAEGWLAVLPILAREDADATQRARMEEEAEAERVLDARTAQQRMARPVARQFSANGQQLVKVQKSRGVYILLGLFIFGLLGAHNFYAGHNGRGVAQLLITVLTGWFVVPLFAVALWVILECCMETTDGAGDPMA